MKRLPKIAAALAAVLLPLAALAETPVPYEEFENDLKTLGLLKAEDAYRVVYLTAVFLLIFFYMLNIVAAQREDLRKYVSGTILLVLGACSIAAEAFFFHRWTTGAIGVVLIVVAVADILTKKRNR